MRGKHWLLFIIILLIFITAVLAQSPLIRIYDSMGARLLHGSLLFTTDFAIFNRTIRIWNADTGRLIRTISTIQTANYGGSFQMFAYNDNFYVGGAMFGYSLGLVEQWNITSGRFIKNFPTSSVDNFAHSHPLLVTSTSTAITGNNVITRYNVMTDQIIGSPISTGDGGHAIGLTLWNNRIVSCSNRGNGNPQYLRVFNLTDPRDNQTYTLPFVDGCALILCHENYVFVSQFNKPLYQLFWRNGSTARIYNNFNGGTYSVDQLNYWYGGKLLDNWLYFASGNTVEKRNVETGALDRTFTANATVATVVVSKKYVIAGTKANTIWQWWNFDCPRGTGFNSDHTACVPCLAGTFKSISAYSECSACPNGANCSATEFTCQPGFQISQNGNGCAPCPSGFIKMNASNSLCTVRCPEGQEPSPDRAVCVECSDKKYKPEGFDSCLNCPLNSDCSKTNFSCSAGFELLNNTVAGLCNQCSEGYFKSSTGNQSCSICDIGFEPSLNQTACKQCSDGTFKPDSTLFKTCVACPNGANCTSSTMSCQPGFTASLNQSYTCNNCEKGYYKTSYGNIQCDKCPIPLFSNEDFTACLPCDSGYFLDSGDLKCYRCGIGKQPNKARTQCMNCTSGYFKPKDELDICIQCPRGAVCDEISFTCTEGYSLNLQKTGCNLCSLGYIKSTTGNQSCNACPLGTTANSLRTQCLSCPDGQVRYAQNPPFCIPCPHGAECTKSSFTCKNGFEKNVDGTACVDKSLAIDNNNYNVTQIQETGSSLSSSSSIGQVKSEFSWNDVIYSPITYVSLIGIIGVLIIITICCVKLRKQLKSEIERFGWTNKSSPKDLIDGISQEDLTKTSIEFLESVTITPQPQE